MGCIGRYLQAKINAAVHGHCYYRHQRRESHGLQQQGLTLLPVFINPAVKKSGRNIFYPYKNRVQPIFIISV